MAIASTQNILSAVDEASLAGKAYEVLEELIVTLQLTPGQVLSEAGLAKQLGIGRTPVREALQQLAREGLVSILPRRGVIVSEINVKNQMELLRVRREVERLMARLAAERGRPNEARELLEIASAMRRRQPAATNWTIRLDHRPTSLLATLAATISAASPADAGCRAASGMITARCRLPRCAAMPILPRAWLA
jgi:DNA-binding GntR family transcriptional regulator